MQWVFRWGSVHDSPRFKPAMPLGECHCRAGPAPLPDSNRPCKFDLKIDINNLMVRQMNRPGLNHLQTYLKIQLRV